MSCDNYVSNVVSDDIVNKYGSYSDLHVKNVNKHGVSLIYSFLWDPCSLISFSIRIGIHMKTILLPNNYTSCINLIKHIKNLKCLSTLSKHTCNKLV